MTQRMLALLLLAAAASAAMVYKHPERVAHASDTFSTLLRNHEYASSRTVEIARASNGEFALRARINGVSAPRVVDTGATLVVLTYEPAKAAGLPLELLDYDVDVATADGHTRAARLTLDRLAIGRLVEHAVPALVVPRGRMKTNLLGMSFLNRLQSWEVRSNHLVLHPYP